MGMIQNASQAQKGNFNKMVLFPKSNLWMEIMEKCNFKIH